VAVALAALTVVPGGNARTPPLRGAQMHPLWGNATAADSARELDKLKEAGATAVRVDFGWSTLEQDGKGSYQTWYIQKTDDFLAAAEERGIRVILTLWTTPCWASSAPPDVKQDCAGAWWDRGVDRYPPANPRDYADAASWVADRWGNELAALEIWNEPNLTPFFVSSDRSGDYAALLKAAYPAVKAQAPNLPVIGPSMFNADTTFLGDLYSEGAGPYLDGISSHPYTSSRSPYDEFPTDIRRSYIKGIPAVQDVMAAHGDGHKKQWLTELGWPSCAPAGTSTWCVTLEKQAEYIGDAFRIIREEWDFVDAAIVYNLRNRGTAPGDREGQMGLLFRDFSPKPSWEAFTTAMKAVTPPPSPPPSAPAPPQNEHLTPSAGVASAQPTEPDEPVPPSAEPAPPPPPTLRRLRVLPRRFRATRRGPAIVSRAGATVRYRLSSAATVTFTVMRLGGRGRSLPAGAPFVDAGQPGANSFRFSARLGGRRLPPGRYALVAVPANAASGLGSARRASFRVVR
jgi:hypothetical protein